MNNLFTLIKANIINSWGINKILKSKSGIEKIKAVLLAAVIVYAFCMLAVSMFMMYYPLGSLLEEADALEFLISSSILSTTFFALAVSVYKIPGYLFTFKDFDLLMGLPVKPSAVIASKLIFIYLSNLLTSLIIGIPPLIVYGMRTSSGAIYYLFVAVTTFFIPLIPISIGALLAYFLGRVSSKFRSTNIVLLAGSFILLIGTMAGSTLISQVSAQHVRNSIPVSSRMNEVLFWTGFYVKALKDRNVLSLMVFILFSILVFGVFIAVFSKGFKLINARLTEKYSSANFKMISLKTSSLMKALYIKELKFYFSSYIYVVNTAFGVIMMTIFSFGISIFGKDAISKFMKMPMTDNYVIPVIVLMLIFCIISTSTTASAVSMEGKSFWIIKSLPVKEESVLWSKILVNLTLTVPAVLINSSVLVFSFKMRAATTAAIVGVSLMYCLFSPISGILINLYFPKFEWTTHTAVVKQSASVLLTMLAGFVSAAIPVLLFIAFKPANIDLFLGTISIILLVINMILVKLLRTTGVRKFKEL